IMNLKFLYFVGFFLLGLSACSEFFSINIENQEIEIISPKDSLFVNKNHINFWWEENSDIESYQIQVVTPNFDNPTIIMDTILSGTALEMDLDEGIYTWRIRGVNAGSESAYFYRLFVVDQTAPLPAQLLYPPDSAIVSLEDNITLQWKSRDPVINDLTFSVWDSVYLYRKIASQYLLVESFMLEENFSQMLDIHLFLEPSQKYQWEIRSFDKANNKALSPRYSFQTE
ncbi:MAG: hypothetical protein R3B93_19175, partial [Bacteroidia bacterium]